MADKDNIIDLTGSTEPSDADELDLEGFLESVVLADNPADNSIPQAPPSFKDPQTGAGQTATKPLEAADPPADTQETEAAQSDTEGRAAARKRKRYDPFKDMDPVLSSDAGLKARELTSLAELKRIKRARVRHEGKRVLTDDVKLLKSLSIEPHLPPGEYINYYIEPIRIEYYIPKESRFVTESRFLYIPLIDPAPREQDKILKDHMQRNAFVDIIKLMNEYPMYITSLIETYNESMSMYEQLSRFITEAESGAEEHYRKAFYMTEVLAEMEPSLAALEYLGSFMAWNLNVLVRRMNVLGLDFSAADKTISYFIKKRNIYWEENQLPLDERFEVLAALFFDQAFPNRGLQYEDEDFFGDIFDTKFKI
ncbi:MAG: hypothetical protein KDK39_08230 [Leptospiraceae bacterium]|nr:hypothetical protein [Leptospiraceae bacterium]